MDGACLLEPLSGTGKKGYKEALKIINKYLKLEPANPDLYVRRALVHFYGQDFSGHSGADSMLIIQDLFYAKSIEEYHIKANYWINWFEYHTANAANSSTKVTELKSNACKNMKQLQSILEVQKTSDHSVDDFISTSCMQF